MFEFSNRSSAGLGFFYHRTVTPKNGVFRSNLKNLINGFMV